MADKQVISREYLRNMRDLANEFSKSTSAKVNWKKHLINLSDACDTLDAVMARAEISSMELDGKKIRRIGIEKKE